MKLIKKIKNNASEISRWAIFITAAFALTFSIADASANETLKLIIENPELAEFTTLVNAGYLFFM